MPALVRCKSFTFIASCLLVLLPGYSWAAANLGISSGVDYTSGDYGSNDDIKDVYVPVSLLIDYDKLAFRITIPYLSVQAPTGSTTISPGNSVVLGTPGTSTTESGLGDITASMTVYDIITNRTSNFVMDSTIKVKAATADEDKGLGTGENDYSAQLDFYKYVNDLTWIAGVGYKLRGDPDDLNLNNVFFASLGASYRLSNVTRIGLIGDYRESALERGDVLKEISGFISHRLNSQWSLSGYLLTGLSDGSADWGTGFRVKYFFDKNSRTDNPKLITQ